jgi:hypothetical protein
MENGDGSQTMQATNTPRQFGFNAVGTTLIALGIAASIAIGAAGGAVIDSLPTLRSSETAVVLPSAHSSANQGEGLLAGTSAVTAAVRAFTADEQGEGIVGGNMAVAAPLVAHTSLGQGEGIIGGLGGRAALATPVTAYASVGMGEGWLANGRPDATIKAFASDGQGEGWLANGRP